MDELSRHFINQFQGGFPIAERPFYSVAADLGTDEATLISAIQKLLDDGVLSRFGPMYDAVAMGGGMTLAAMSVAEQDFEKIAEQVNDFPEVAHNYRRDHEMNMWFVIATETPAGVQEVIREIETSTGLAVYNFPKLQEFYLGLWLLIDENNNVSTTSIDVPELMQKPDMDDLDRQIIRATQQGLPLTTNPFQEITRLINADMETVLHRLQAMVDAGIIRRVGAVPNHYRLGLKGNGMSVWNVPDDRLAFLGKKVGNLNYVSHCYERPRHLPLWPYNLFAMVHGHDSNEVNEKVSRIADMLGDDCQQHEVLFSSAILKKTGLRLVA